MRKPLAAVALLALNLTATASVALAADGGPNAFRLYVRDDGVYQVTFEQLAQAGLARKVPTDLISLYNQGEAVPLWVDDGGDGELGPGDRLELVGHHLPGDSGTYYNDFSRYNVYQLLLNRGPGRRMVEVPAEGGGRQLADKKLLATMRERHLEEDQLLIRLGSGDLTAEEAQEASELWYWAKLSQIDKKPFKTRLPLYDLDNAAGGEVTAVISLLGLSEPAEDFGMPHHVVEVALDDEVVARGEWNGREPFLLELPPLPAERLAGGRNVLSLDVPLRRPAPGEPSLVDVVMLNWIALRYPAKGRVTDEPLRFELAGVEAAQGPATADPEAPAPGLVRLRAARGAEELLLYGDGGSRITASPGGKDDMYRFLPVAGERFYWALPQRALAAVDRIEADAPSNLRSTSHRADYLMIAHASLLEAAAPLAELHRSRGLQVELVDVQDVYDEFHSGIPHPQAIHDFIDHAYHHWARPAPRFVLLVGDASWDVKNEVADDANYANWTDRGLVGGQRQHFRARETTEYETVAGAERNLIPTWSYASSEGHSASDNYFVTVEGDDFFPDLAIGRLPVVTPQEVAAIVAKTKRYIASPEPGSWRRRALFITNESNSFQRRSDHLAGQLVREGFAASKVYPSSAEKSNEKHQEFLRHAFDEGQVLVHFVGHGGRFIWRTGPPDTEKNHDLFTLDHLDELQPTGKLPVVLSMTCHSGPFDHPTADSIGEKFLRLPDRGAVAVVASSWRNAPSRALSQALVRELTRPGARVGEALMRAKQGLRQRVLVETYNLLGDPALPLALPRYAAKLTAEPGGPVEVTLPFPTFAGQVEVEWLDDDGDLLQRQQVEVTAPTFELPRPEGVAAAVVSLYALSDGKDGFDAMGGLDLAALERKVPKVRHIPLGAEGGEEGGEEP